MSWPRKPTTMPSGPPAAPWAALLAVGGAWLLAAVSVARFEPATPRHGAWAVAALLALATLGELVHLATATTWRRTHAALALLSSVVAVLCLVGPGSRQLGLTALVSLVLIARGAADVAVAAMRRASEPAWGALLALGAGEALTGLWCAAGFARSPGLLLVAVGIFAMLRGIAEIVAAVRLREAAQAGELPEPAWAADRREGYAAAVLDVAAAATTSLIGRRNHATPTAKHRADERRSPDDGGTDGAAQDPVLAGATRRGAGPATGATGGGSGGFSGGGGGGRFPGDVGTGRSGNPNFGGGISGSGPDVPDDPDDPDAGSGTNSDFFGASLRRAAPAGSLPPGDPLDLASGPAPTERGPGPVRSGWPAGPGASDQRPDPADPARRHDPEAGERPRGPELPPWQAGGESPVWTGDARPPTWADQSRAARSGEVAPAWQDGGEPAAWPGRPPVGRGADQFLGTPSGSQSTQWGATDEPAAWPTGERAGATLPTGPEALDDGSLNRPRPIDPRPGWAPTDVNVSRAPGHGAAPGDDSRTDGGFHQLTNPPYPSGGARGAAGYRRADRPAAGEPLEVGRRDEGPRTSASEPSGLPTRAHPVEPQPWQRDATPGEERPSGLPELSDLRRRGGPPEPPRSAGTTPTAMPSGLPPRPGAPGSPWNGAPADQFRATSGAGSPWGPAPEHAGDPPGSGLRSGMVRPVEKPTAEPTPVTYGRPDYPTPHPVHPHGNDPALPRPAADYRGDDGADAENGSALSRWLGGRSKRRP